MTLVLGLIDDLARILTSFHLPAYPYPTVLTTAVLLLITSEGTSFYAGSVLFKTIASLAFLLAGVHTATGPPRTLDLLSWESISLPEHRSAVFLLLGLLFSVFGDVLLIPSPEIYHQKIPSKTEGETLRFKAGVLFFALAHVVYAAAFIADTSSGGIKGIRWFTFFTTLKVGALLIYVLGLLAKNPAPGAMVAVPADMRGLVTVYVVIIWTMVATATATDAGYQKIAGGWIFMVSDLFVAADVYSGKKPAPRPNARGRYGWESRSIGWIAYFGAQLLLAGCI
ncbi:hypothetical protein BDN70DRAFT_871660 [Pholiota conissans]|uniref:YhhN-like protein n=1 Tax=Pholiota conissans TaxID=109636 RepID=A0A9P5ZD47_9AGAR|nr:hypothetical protein BDN70DRAFT_871660 [Pholiota conissans]